MLQESIEPEIEEKTNDSVETTRKTTENEDDEIKVGKKNGANFTFAPIVRLLQAH